PRGGVAAQRDRPGVDASAGHAAQPGVRDRALSGRRAGRRQSLTALILCLVLLLGAPIAGGFLAPRPGAQPAPRVAPPAGRTFTIAQLQYGGGGDWYANPSGLPTLLREIRERTGLPVADRPVHVKLTDAALWTYPYIYITGHGNIRLTDEEVVLL